MHVIRTEYQLHILAIIITIVRAYSTHWPAVLQGNCYVHTYVLALQNAYSIYILFSLFINQDHQHVEASFTTKRALKFSSPTPSSNGYHNG